VSDTTPERRYGPTSGTFTGVLGLVACCVVIGLVVEDLSATSVRVGIAAVAAAVVFWAFMLRPRVILESGGSTLVLRNPLSSWRIPLASVREVGVKTMTTVKTDDARYDAVAVGYPLRKVVRSSRPGTAESAPVRARVDVQMVMVETILAAADKARVHGLQGDPAVRVYAVVELGLVAVAVVGFVATYMF
jgi:hypothetical protein